MVRGLEFWVQIVSIPLAVLVLICPPPLFAQVGPKIPLDAFVSVKDAGATGDGLTDDTAAIQSALNRFSQQMSGAQARGGTIYFPAGVYLISKPLFYYGGPGTGIRIQGALGRTRGTGYGSTIRWKGARGATMFIAIGMNNSQFDNIEFDLNRLARFGIHQASTNGVDTTLRTAVTPGSATVTPGSMANIAVGTVLNIGSGSNMEPVYVMAITGSTFTAIFSNSHLPADPVGKRAGGSGVKFKDVSVLNVPGSPTDCARSPGTCTAAIAVGNPTSRATSQTSEMAWDNVHLESNSSSSGSAGIAVLEAGNCKNFSAKDLDVDGFQYGVDWYAASGAFSLFRPTFAGETVADIRVGTGNLYVTGAESENASGHQFLVGSAGANNSNAVIVASSWQASAPPSDYIISYAGNLTLIGNSFFNFRTSSSVPKIQIGSPLGGGNNPTTITSYGNFFWNMTGGYVPLYDSSNNQVLPSYYNHQPVDVTSLGDYGGTGDHIIKLNNYLTASALTSQTAAAVAANGVIRAGDTDTAVAFRNHANRTDIPGLAKDASDVVFVGGAAGVGLNSPIQAGNGANGDIQAPAKGTGTGPKTPGIVVGWVPIKVGDSTYFVPVMK